MLRDVSTKGFLIESDHTFLVGADIVLELPDVEAKPGRVIWHAGRYTGASFSTPISPSLISSLLAASPVVWPRFGTDCTSIGEQRRADLRPLVPSPALISPVRRMKLIVAAGIIAWLPVMGCLILFA
jgi:hypothetical protein